MKTKPDISDEQIRSYMNFDALLDQRNKIVKARDSISPLKLIILISMLLMLATVWYYAKVSDNSISDSPNNKPVTEDAVLDQSSSLPGESGNQQEETESVTSVNENENSTLQDKENKTIQPHEKRNIEPETQPKEEEKNPQLPLNISEEKTVAPEVNYVQAEPLNGYPALYEYFNKELQYPQEAIKDSIQGIVAVTFYINTEGSAGRIKIENSLGELFDKEVIRLIENMPLWKPATINGKPVESKLSLPLTFNIKRIKE